MDIILNQIIPFHRLTYIQQYIERSHAYKAQNRFMVRKIHRTFWILLFQSLHFLYQFWFSDFAHLGIDPLIDYIRISHLPPEVYPFLVGICALSGFYLYLLYCGPFEVVNALFYDVLIQRRSRFFVSEVYGRKMAVEWARDFVFSLVNLFQGFMVVVGEFLFSGCIFCELKEIDLFFGF